MSEQKTGLRVGLLGCGQIAAAVHLPVLTGLGQVRVVAVAESDPKRAGLAAGRVPEAVLVAGAEDMLSREDLALDAVVITLPNDLHARMARRAFQRGLHVYLEKPLALDAQEGREVVAAWRAAGTIGMIGYSYRFLPQYQRARALVREGALGRLILLRSIFCTAGPLPAWKQKRETGGGVLADLLSHHLDLAVWLAGAPPLAVTCELCSRASADDTALVHLEFPEGLRAQLVGLFGAPEQHCFEILGERGELVVDPNAFDDVQIRRTTLDRVRLNGVLQAARALASPSYWAGKLRGEHGQISFRSALTAFVEGALQNRPVAPDLADGLTSLVWMDAARESARRRARVTAEGS